MANDPSGQNSACHTNGVNKHDTSVDTLVVIVVRIITVILYVSEYQTGNYKKNIAWNLKSIIYRFAEVIYRVADIFSVCGAAGGRCGCMWVCLYEYIHTRININLYTHIRTHTHTHTHTRMHRYKLVYNITMSKVNVSKCCCCCCCLCKQFYKY